MDFPICRLLLNEEEKNTFVYTAEDEPYLTVTFDTSGSVDYKRHSDGDMLPDPFIQQMVFVPEEDSSFTILFSLRDGAVMRPARAREGQAILSQEGKPLIYGVNGVYDFDGDTLISWHGFTWNYEGDRVERKDGRDYICIRGTAMAGKPALINVCLQYYRRHLGFEFHNPRQFRYNKTGVCGWATWEAFRHDISPDLIEKSAVFLSKTLKSYGLQYIQIDDGYQSRLMPPEGVNSIKTGWLTLNEKFPGGHKSIVAAITGAGFKAALWTNAAISNETYAVESGRCIIGKDGLPLKGPWIGCVFDCTEESAEEIYELYRELAAKGYTYFKVDALRHLLFDGLMAAVRQGLISNREAVERFRRYMDAVRRGIGKENYLLSCWGVLSLNAGIADAMRFGSDISAGNDSLLVQIDESARWHVTHGVLYRNDPDYICLRMETPQARLSAGLASLNGYLYMISDDTRLYTGDKLDIARKTMPPTGAVTAETGPLNRDTPMNYYKNMVAFHDTIPALAPGCLWASHFVLGDRSWTVVQVLRPSAVAVEQDYAIPLENLGLDPAQRYEAFDFWEQKPLGPVEKTFRPQAPAAFGSRVIALSPLKRPIELIGSSRHISMDNVSVRDLNWKAATLTLSLEGIPGEQFNYWFLVQDSNADGKTEFSIRCTGGTVAALRQGPYLACSVTFAEKRAELSVS
jgi:alpha-galactosidase